jgi:hypothetical protein
MPYEIPPRTLVELHADIRKDHGRVHGEARQAYTRITGNILPNPGDHVTWICERTGSELTGTVDDVVLHAGTFQARIDGDLTGGTHRVRHSIDVRQLKHLSLAGGAR